ncbi:uncharacterized protein [Venturia canescens]|uniref:uncharacterized protein n=1 Tax=Venturia canescens TaxID=32260 RepID=UPI001C9BE4AF|nr:uncharacterized protein LOC122418908 [Venturia canescens]
MFTYNCNRYGWFTKPLIPRSTDPRLYFPLKHCSKNSAFSVLFKVTCPGVWLCPNGKVGLRINTLNSKIESRQLNPAFPLLYHDKFRFKKLFTGVGTLAELQSSLEDEYLYTELVQWSSSKGNSVVLATFETNLADLLYPPSCSKGLLTGSEVDLLMEPTKYFPGILAPKIEVSTRTTIEEVIGVFEKTNSRAQVINPKMINSKNGTCVHRKRPSKGIIRQRKVCHTQGKVHENRALRQMYVNPEGASSTPSSASNNLSPLHIARYCHKSKGTCNSTSRGVSPFRKKSHILDNCAVCSKYKCYFSHHDHCEGAKSTNNVGENSMENFHNMYDSSKCLRHSCIEQERGHEEIRPRSAPHDAPAYITPSSSILRPKSREFQGQGIKSNYVGGDCTRFVDYFDCEKEQGRQGFYKNLEKFYKRMYKQAKIRAQEVNCS